MLSAPKCELCGKAHWSDGYCEVMAGVPEQGLRDDQWEKFETFLADMGSGGEYCNCCGKPSFRCARELWLMGRLSDRPGWWQVWRADETLCLETEEQAIAVRDALNAIALRAALERPRPGSGAETPPQPEIPK